MIKIVRISSGDMIIGDCEAISASSSVRIKNPLFIVPTEQGFVSVDMINFFSDDKEITIVDSHILYQLNPAEEITDKYKQKLSGIALPSKSIIGV